MRDLRKREVLLPSTKIRRNRTPASARALSVPAIVEIIGVLDPLAVGPLLEARRLEVGITSGAAGGSSKPRAFLHSSHGCHQIPVPGCVANPVSLFRGVRGENLRAPLRSPLRAKERQNLCVGSDLRRRRIPERSRRVVVRPDKTIDAAEGREAVPINQA